MRSRILFALLLAALPALPACSPAHGSPVPFGFGPRRFVSAAPGTWSHIETQKQDPTLASQTAGSSVSETFSGTPNVGDLIVAYVGASDGCAGAIITSITDNQSNTYTLLSKVVALQGAFLGYSVITTASGTFIVTANISSGCSHSVAFGISDFRDTGGTPSFDTSSNDSGTSATQGAGTITPAASNELFVDAVATDSGGSPGGTPSNSYVARVQYRTGVPHLSGSSLIAVGSSAQTAAWTGGTSPTYVGIQAAFKP